MNVQPIEGITPSALWTTASVLLGLAGIAIIIFKIVEFYWKAKDRKATTKQLEGKDLTDVIADKVLEKLEPRFREIDKKLDKDKERLEVHESSINGINQALGVIKEGVEVSCNALAEVLDHELHNGNGTQMEHASAELRKYTTSLIKKV